MAIPKSDDFYGHVLWCILDGEKNRDDCCAEVARKLGLTEDERQERTKGGHDTRLHNRVSRALSDLFKAGCAKRPSPGCSIATERGRELYREHGDCVNRHVLLQFPEFRAHKNER